MFLWKKNDFLGMFCLLPAWLAFYFVFLLTGVGFLHADPQNVGVQENAKLLHYLINAPWSIELTGKIAFVDQKNTPAFRLNGDLSLQRTPSSLECRVKKFPFLTPLLHYRGTNEKHILSGMGFSTFQETFQEDLIQNLPSDAKKYCIPFEAISFWLLGLKAPSMETVDLQTWEKSHLMRELVQKDKHNTWKLQFSYAIEDAKQFPIPNHLTLYNETEKVLFEISVHDLRMDHRLYQMVCHVYRHSDHISCA